MPSVLAIVSKAIYERDAKRGGRVAGVGDVVALDRYVSKNKGLTPVGAGGGAALFLVTVRPPDEHLWLVAILEAPAFDGEQWVSAPSTIPVTDVSALKDKLRFANGGGISAKKGALGMSLQTPRALTDADVALLRGASGGAAPAAAAKGHLNAHEPDSRTPCLCRRCIGAAPESFTVDGLMLVRDKAEGGDRHLWYWLPESIAAQKTAVRRAVASRLQSRARATRAARPQIDEVFAAEDEDE